MLDEYFSSYLHTCYPPEYVDMINSCREALLLYEYSYMESQLYKTIPQESDITIFDSKLLFEQALRDGFNEIFRALGLRSYLTALKDMDMLLRTIKNLETSDDHEYILQIIHNDELSISELFEELIVKFNFDGNFGDIIFFIELAPDSVFFERLEKLHVEKLNSTDDANDETPEPLNPQYIKRIREFNELYPESLAVKKYLDNKIKLYDSLENYFVALKDDLTSYYPTDPSSAAYAIISIMNYANVEIHKVIGSAKDTAMNFYNDLRFTRQVNIKIDAIIEKELYERQPTNVVRTSP